MAADEPTLHEVLRKLNEVVATLTKLADRLDRDYVRKDVNDERLLNIAIRITKAEAEAEEAEEKALERERQKERDAASFRRQIIVGLVVAAVPAVLGLVLAINNFLAAGGATP